MLRKNQLLLAAFAILLAIPGLHGQLPNQQKMDSLAGELKKLPADTNRARTLTRLGAELLNVGMFDSARTHLAEALQLADKLNFTVQKGKILNLFGITFFYQGKTPEALAYWEQALPLAMASGNPNLLAQVETNLGNAQQMMGNLPASVDYYLKALSYYESAQDKGSIAMVYANLGVVYGQSEDPEKAKEYLLKALVIDSTLGHLDQIIRGRINLANVYIPAREFDWAEQQLNAALDLGRQHTLNHMMGPILIMLGNLRMEQFRLSEAIDYLKESNAYLRPMGDVNQIATNQGRMGVIFMDMTKPEHKRELDTYFGGDKKKALTAAQSEIDSALAVMQQTGDLTGQKVAYQTLAQIYQEKGEYKKALDNQIQYKVLSDSIFNIERDRKITQTSMQYAFDKKEAAARALQEKKDIRQRTIRNSIAGVLGGSLIFLTVVMRQRNRISREKQRSEELLLNILPEEVAEELKATGAAEARHFDIATILFTDFKNFTELSGQMTPAALVDELNTCFKTFDALMVRYKIEKIKTIGDAYMAAGGLPDPQHGSPADVIMAALEMQDFMTARQAERAAAGLPYFEMRLGIHTGPVVAGIVGVKKFQYDIWGDTVNMASRMETAGETGKVNISEATHAAIKDTPGLAFSYRGKLPVKGKGDVSMWFVERV